jgi:hypothetical protein
MGKRTYTGTRIDDQAQPDTESDGSPITGRDRSLRNLKRGGQPGRKPGVPNKATVAVKEAARELVEQAAYREALARRLVSGRLAPAMETTLWHYAYGRPKESTDLTVRVSRMIRITPPTENAA